VPNHPPSPPTPAQSPGTSSWWTRWGLLAAGAAGIAAAAASAVFLQPALAPESPIVEAAPSDFPKVPAYAIDDPAVVSARAADLKEDEPVIGVSVDGKHRAYRIRAFCDLPMVHVVNDHLGDRPVSVAYCDRTGCTAVVQEDEGSPRLHLTFGGWYRGQMYVRAHGDHFYALNNLVSIDPKAPPFPYARADFERTTWGAWRQAHPDTDVYVAPPRKAFP
jgi:hypothetical protein